MGFRHGELVICRFVRLLDDVLTPANKPFTSHDDIVDLARRSRRYRHLFNPATRALSREWLESHPLAIDSGFLGFDTRTRQLDIYGSYDGKIHGGFLDNRWLGQRREYTKEMFTNVYRAECIRAIT